MLILLAQATHGYRAHLACGVLREHGVEAHVFHENSGVLHGGASTTTASLWVHDDEWQDAHEILATAPIEPLPKGDEESMNISKEFFPPAGAIVVGVAGAVWATFALVGFFALLPQLVTHGLDKGFDLVLAFLLMLLIKGIEALCIGLAVGVPCALSFSVIRWHREKWWPGVALITLVTLIMAATVCVCTVS